MSFVGVAYKSMSKVLFFQSRRVSEQTSQIALKATFAQSMIEPGATCVENNMNHLSYVSKILKSVLKKKNLSFLLKFSTFSDRSQYSL